MLPVIFITVAGIFAFGSVFIALCCLAISGRKK